MNAVWSSATGGIRRFAIIAPAVCAVFVGGILHGAEESNQPDRRILSALARARQALLADSPENAEAHVARALEINARSIPALMMQARIQVISKDFDSALVTLDDILRADPYNQEAHWLAAASHGLLEQFDESLPHLREIVSIGGITPIVYKALAQRASIRLTRDDLDGALADLEDSEFVAYELFHRVLVFPPSAGRPTPELAEQRRIAMAARLSAINHYVNMRQHRARLLLRMGRGEEVAEALAGILELTERENAGILLEYAFGHYDAVIDEAAERPAEDPIAGEFMLRILAFASMALGDTRAADNLSAMSQKAERIRSNRRFGNESDRMAELEERFDEIQELLLTGDSGQARDLLTEVYRMKMATHPAFRMAVVQRLLLDAGMHESQQE